MMQTVDEKLRKERGQRLLLLGWILISMAALFAVWGGFSAGFTGLLPFKAWDLLCAKSPAEQEGYYMLAFVLGAMGAFSLGSAKIMK